MYLDTEKSRESKIKVREYLYYSTVSCKSRKLKPCNRLSHAAHMDIHAPNTSLFKSVVPAAAAAHPWNLVPAAAAAHPSRI
ncbi:hypothetical protein WN944_026490 [Citrus x changshan-huyou]|uniref:Uncharacterized protein n=1 Tax=Citrus x changshan-huyou TaxID=2935761 RepID=A0AAP0LRQ3_9ROSI